MGNPPCPEPKCNQIMRLRKLKTELGLSPCPRCGSFERKIYVLTEKKNGQFRCSKCHFDYTPKRRQGMVRFFICRIHKHQKFKVGAETIIAKSAPMKTESIKKMEEMLEKPKKPRPRRRI